MATVSQLAEYRENCKKNLLEWFDLVNGQSLGSLIKTLESLGAERRLKPELSFFIDKMEIVVLERIQIKYPSRS